MEKIFQQLALHTAVIIVSAQIIPSSKALETDVTKLGAPEIMPDGNLRDPVPTPETLSKFASRALANMVEFKGGTFEMGDWGAEVNDGGLPFDASLDSKPLHKVKLDRFSIAKYPVTYAEFDVFTASLKIPRINQKKSLQSYRKPDNPAGVTWEGAKEFCQWLGKITNKPIDLPTEAQWEYSARSGGKRNVYSTDNGKLDIGRNLPSYDQRKSSGGLVAVTSFPPNSAGIYYMGAGVHEWINDWYDEKYYSISPTDNPKGPSDGAEHVVRGDFGYADNAMTFTRWHVTSEQAAGTWTAYAKKPGELNRNIPVTKYSGKANSAFRCALN
jgi:sulfatase modifying factor 1